MSTLRAGLAFLAVIQAVLGVWPLTAPQSFYDNFPLPTNPWVAYYPPFNEHLLRDFGALNLALCVVLVFAVVKLERSLTQAALVAYLVFAVPHMTFHLFHLGHMPVVDQIGNVVTLAAVVLIPLALLPLTRRITPKIDSSAGR
ncbi:hypothetical protein BBK82_01710 [Lentzea guizhouensis]|uniref:EXPERA domain-containing protein n=1 Tax=Lentzea guizhouensis TaxID=1586287 RepID=A0A1B2HB94_9PSEU|nr:hypothetical protein [Lentzea guizhouensis]ANZ34979.1 hypothetical protein BBK82_01710 [Lentzea guizhouensis]